MATRESIETAAFSDAIKPGKLGIGRRIEVQSPHCPNKCLLESVVRRGLTAKNAAASP
jgi:hypothetical protein